MQPKKTLEIVMVIICVVVFWAIPIFCPSTYVFASDRTKTYEKLRFITDVLEVLEKNYVDEINEEKLLEKALEGLAAGLDAHSQFLPPEAQENLIHEIKGEISGVGLEINQKENQIVVIAPIEGTPAYRAGIQTGDVIMQVDDKSMKNAMIWEATKLLRGKKGTTVKVVIFRPSSGEVLPITLKRDNFPIESVKSALLKPGYGYVWITNFQERTTADLKKAVISFEKETALKGLILDLRDNPGGLLDQAIGVSDFFLSEGEIVSMRGRDKEKKQTIYATKEGTRNDFAMVVLINGGSASASEIVAGALQDQKRAVLLGTTSFGKGSVQTVHPLAEGYALRYTVARYYTPNGRSIQAEGIKPDIEVPNRFVKGLDKPFHLKESDLQNHLTSENEKKPEKKLVSDKQEKSLNDEDRKVVEEIIRSRQKPTDPEKLLQDNQIKTAFEVLTGHVILSQKGNLVP